MSLLKAFDESEEIVKAEIFTKGLSKLPEIAIVCFKKELIDYIEKDDSFEEYSSIYECGEEIKIYHTVYQGKDIALYRTLIGGPATVLMMEELASRGVKKFIFFGSCGLLDSKFSNGAFIIPTEAYRDEGTSFHYLPKSDFVKVDSAEELISIFKKNHIKYVTTKTWTTDAIYRETVNKVKDRLSLGYQVVEMECASVMAMCQKRGLKAYYFLYSEDTLDNEEWDLKTLKEDRTFILKECLKIALNVAKNI